MAADLCETNLTCASKFDDVCDNWLFDWSPAVGPHCDCPFVKALECGAIMEEPGLLLRTGAAQSSSFSSSTAIEDKEPPVQLSNPHTGSKASVTELDSSDWDGSFSDLHLDRQGMGRRDFSETEDDAMDTSSERFVSEADLRTTTSEEDETSTWHAVDSPMMEDELLVTALKPKAVVVGGNMLHRSNSAGKKRLAQVIVRRASLTTHAGPRRVYAVSSSNFNRTTSEELTDADETGEQALDEHGAWQQVVSEQSSGASGACRAAFTGRTLDSSKRLAAPRLSLSGLVTVAGDERSPNNLTTGLGSGLNVTRLGVASAVGAVGEALPHSSAHVVAERTGEATNECANRPARPSRPAKAAADGVTSPRGKKRASSSSKSGPAPGFHACTQCGTQTTPVWRAGPHGPKTLCNACGVRYMKIAKKR